MPTPSRRVRVGERRAQCLGTASKETGTGDAHRLWTPQHREDPSEVPEERSYRGTASIRMGAQNTLFTAG